MQVQDYEMTKADANGGVAIRDWLNAAFSAIATNNSGNEAPTTTYAFMWWYDTSDSTYYYLKQRNADNSAWNTIIRYKVADKSIDFMLGESALSDLLSAKAAKATTLLGYGITNANTKEEIAILLSDLSTAMTEALALKAPLANPTFTGSVVVPTPTTSGQAIPMGAILEKTAVGMGYGTGAGGTVTQATSKSTAVTINKPSGQITMNAASLASGSEVIFNVNNSLISTKDTVTVNHVAIGTSTGNAYEPKVGIVWDGGFSIKVKNVNSGALAEAIVIEFNTFKGANA